MSDEPSRVLLIEDNPGDARLIQEMLAEFGRGRFDLRRADRLSTALEWLAEGGIDVILSDLSLPDSRELDTFAKVRAQAPHLPVIVLTGLDDETAALEAVQEGAQDYLVKGQIDGNLLVRAMRYAIERKRVEEALRLSEEKFSKAFRASPDMMIIIRLRDGCVIDVNDGFTHIAGYRREEFVGSMITETRVWASLEERDRLLQTLQEQERFRNLEASFRAKSGQTREGLMSAELIDIGGELCMLAVAKDITERKQAEAEVARHAKRVEALHTVAQAVSQSLELELMLDGVLEKVLEVAEVKAGYISSFDMETGAGAIKAHRRLSERFINQMEKARTKEDVRRWQERREPAFGLHRMYAEPERIARVAAAAEDEGLQSFVALPLWSKDVLHGAMVLASHSHRRFSAEELELLKAIAAEIAVGMENAKLLSKTRELSMTDELTGLYNRRHFYDRLEAEVSRTQRYGHSFALAILDLDGFKQHNDKFGHSSGDAVLKSLAQTLKSALRKMDTAFRYGGDEFAIILPSTDAERASGIVDRIRSEWSRVPKPGNVALETPLGFSAGIAQFPENAETVDGLVFLADTALYRSKKEGGYKTRLVSDPGDLPVDVLDRATLDQVYALAATVDARDPYTYGHSKRVAALSEMIGRAIGLSTDELTNLHAAGLLHDIGKIGVPDLILTKPGKPTDCEWKQIRKHSSEGARIVSHVKELGVLIPMIQHHHEWYNGTGYPDGLKGEDIPLGAKIISIADAYDTMTTKRTYRKIISQREALEELRRCTGTQFDPELVEMFCRAITEATKKNKTR